MKALAAVLRNRNLALLLAGQLVSQIGGWLYIVALSVTVYQDSHHNAVYVSLFWLCRFLPDLVLGPVGGSLADRIGYRRSMMVAALARGILVALLALTLTRSDWAIIFPIVLLVSSFRPVFDPASAGLLPSLVRSSDELVAANAVFMQVGALAMVVGSAVGGYVSGLGFVTWVLLFFAAGLGVSVLTVWLIRPSQAAADAETAAIGDEPAPEADETGTGKGILQGFRFLAGRPALVFAASVIVVPELASGAVVVWLVPYAQQSLHLGASGGGYLFAAFGVGSIVGGFVAASLGANIRLDSLLAVSVVAGGALLALFGLIPLPAAALVILALFGMAESVEFTAFLTLLQQSVPNNMIGQAYGTTKSLFTNMTLIGTVASGYLAGSVGLEQSIVGFGIVILVVAALGWRRLYRDTAGRPMPAELAAIPAFANVPVPVREWAVRRMTRESFPGGAMVVRQGEEGDTFYAIARGKAAVEVASDGRTISTGELGPGDVFGEIALLHNVPRTATVQALEPLTVYALKREDFHELLDRASHVKESLLETAASRLQSAPLLTPLLLGE